MKEKVLEIINKIRVAKGLEPLAELKVTDRLTSFDLAELTVNLEEEYDIDIFEDGLVSTVGEIYAKLS